MDEDQQFCLRWNNHQSTIISLFDKLLTTQKLVDCTLSAEGKSIKAHQVILSACSPYFASILAEHEDKHPVFILKDVKFQELRAMMDYMYRGEVNISQEKLEALLSAAESLQIKGLCSRRSDGSPTKEEEKPENSATKATKKKKKVDEPKKPVSDKPKSENAKAKRKLEEVDAGDKASESGKDQENQEANGQEEPSRAKRPRAKATKTSTSEALPEPEKKARGRKNQAKEAPVPVIENVKPDVSAETFELLDELEYDNIDDIELADDDRLAFSADDISSNLKTDKLDSTIGSDNDDFDGKTYKCRHCGKQYRWKSTLRRHENVECGGKEASHECQYCDYKAKQRGNLGVHIRKHHPDKPQLEKIRTKKALHTR